MHLCLQNRAHAITRPFSRHSSTQSSHLYKIEEGVEHGWQCPASHTHVSINREMLKADLHCGHLDAHPAW